MIANKFGVPNNARLYYCDNYKKCSFISNTCDTNPEYGTYCFDSSKHKIGDYVKLFINSYFLKYKSMIQFYKSIGLTNFNLTP